MDCLCAPTRGWVYSMPDGIFWYIYWLSTKVHEAAGAIVQLCARVEHNERGQVRNLGCCHCWRHETACTSLAVQEIKTVLWVMSVLFCGYRCVIVCACVCSNIYSVCPCLRTQNMCGWLRTTRGLWVFFQFRVCIRPVERGAAELCEKPSAPFSLDIWSLPVIFFFTRVTWTRQSQQRVLHKDAGGTAEAPPPPARDTEKIEHREKKGRWDYREKGSRKRRRGGS